MSQRRSKSGLVVFLGQSGTDMCDLYDNESNPL